MVDLSFLFSMGGHIILGLLAAAIWFIICGAPIYIIIKLILREKHKNDAMQKEMFDKAAELTKQKQEKEAREALSKKIIRCQYCGKQTRFGNGTCPHCGGPLEQ